MTLRITTRRTKGKTVVRADGKLAGEEVTELARACGEASRRLVIDLANLESADDAGVALLRALAAAGAELKDVSPYVALLLEGGSGGGGGP